jgi:hypothetical protein
MRSRRGYSLPPDTGKQIGRVQLQGLEPCIFFVQMFGAGLFTTGHGLVLAQDREAKLLRSEAPVKATAKTIARR